jgi:hypothetical protein
MKAKLKITLMIGLLTLSAACGKSEKQAESGARGQNKWDWQAAELEYERIQAELKLARAEKPYLVLDFRKREITIRLKGIEVWDYPMETVDKNYDELADFSKRFQGDDRQLVRTVSGEHLFSASGKTPDSILAIVGRAVNIDPKLLQRQVPQRFQILWANNLILEIRTDIAGKPTSRIKNTIAEVTRALKLPFGEARLVLKMDPERALTLYRASGPGLPTLIVPVP